MTTQAANSPGLATRPLPPAITTDAGSFEAAARAAERVEVSLQSPGPEHRTKLIAFVLTSIETQLEQLGAAPAGYSPRDSLETSLSDQLYRSRLLGAGGIALRFASLEGIADVTGGLSVEDSHALRRMIAFAELEPLQIFLPEQSGRLHVLGAPQRLREWLPAACFAGRVAEIEYEADSLEADSFQHGAEADARSSSPPPGAAREDTELAPPDVAAFLDQPGARVALPHDGRTPSAAGVAAPGNDALSEAARPNEHEPPTVMPVIASTPPSSDGVSAAATPTPANEPGQDQGQQPALSEAPDDAARRMEQQRRCASWLAQLRSMNGPKQHASVERAFVSAYLPLAREVASGHAPEELRAAVESWAEGFAQSYAAAFKTLTGHARRPTMVRDIFDVVLRWLNQYRARSCELLLVDGMRFDLGQRLNEEIERQLAGRAVCRDQALLWAALPSNSVAQRLADAGLTGQPRARAGQAGESAQVDARASIQPLRVGARDLFRLELLAPELARPGELECRRLERMAMALAEQIVPWLRSLPPDTLVVIFGDHGFQWQANEHGTSAAQRGGALPEQVLVPASAWLLGGPRAKAGTAAGLH